MALPSSLVKQFVNVTNDNANSKKNDNTVFGEIVEVNGGTYAKIDGSDMVTPVATTARVKVGDRVVLTLKNHTATVIGNTTDPSASSAKVTEIEGEVTSFNTIVADKATIGELNASIARIEDLEADYATIDELYVGYGEFDELVATSATIENLDATYATVDELKANYADIYELEAKYATIDNLTAANAKINALEANYATIDDLYATKAEVKSLDATYADIDFANVGQAAFGKIYSETGLIEGLIFEDGVVTGELKGVTISGDLIKANTLKADKLIIKGKDGLYYQLNAGVDGVTETELASEEYQNALHGSNIIASTITADKVAISDLSAFHAKIGGLVIEDSSIHSFAKPNIEATTSGFFLDSQGQMSVGDANNYIKYANGKLEITAEQLRLGTSKKSVETIIDETVENIDVGARNLLENSSFHRDHSGWTVAVNGTSAPEDTVKHVTKYGRECAYIKHTELGMRTTVEQNVLTINRDGEVVTKLEPDTEYILSGSVLTENIVQGTTNFFCRLYTEGMPDNFSIGSINIPINTGVGGWTRIHVPLKTDSTKFSAATRLRVYIYARDFTGDLYFSELKLEKGNKVTEWTAAPEDAARASDMTKAQEDIDGLEYEMDQGKADLLVLRDQIASLVQDETGASLMTQTEDGWVFSTASIQEGVNTVAKGLNDLNQALGDTYVTTEELNDAIKDFDKIAERVLITTYKDPVTGNTEPCIELCEGDSDFKLLITNTRILFQQGSDTPAYITNKALYIDTAIIETELKLGDFTWKIHNGNLGLIYEG